MSGARARRVLVTLLLAGGSVTPVACTWTSPSSDALESLDELPQAPTTVVPVVTPDGPATTTTVSATEFACVDGHLATRSYK